MNSKVKRPRATDFPAFTKQVEAKQKQIEALREELRLSQLATEAWKNAHGHVERTLAEARETSGAVGNEVRRLADVLEERGRELSALRDFRTEVQELAFEAGGTAHTDLSALVDALRISIDRRDADVEKWVRVSEDQTRRTLELAAALAKMVNQTVFDR